MPVPTIAVPERGTYNCILHGQRHRMAAECTIDIAAWYADHRPDVTDSDLRTLTEAQDYLRAFGNECERAAEREGDCAGCRRTGMACLVCDPPKDHDLLPAREEPDFDNGEGW